MIIEVKVNSVRLVSPDIYDIVESAYVIAEGIEVLMNDYNVDIRKNLINQFGDGERIYILVPERASTTHIIVDMIDSQPPYRHKRKSTIQSSSDLKILYKKEVEE